MLPALQYAWLTLKHKWFVLRAGIWTKAPIWLLLVHDLSKFGPWELRAYGEQFYGKQSDPLGFARALGAPPEPQSTSLGVLDPTDLPRPRRIPWRRAPSDAGALRARDGCRLARRLAVVRGPLAESRTLALAGATASSYPTTSGDETSRRDGARGSLASNGPAPSAF